MSMRSRAASMGRGMSRNVTRFRSGLSSGASGLRGRMRVPSRQTVKKAGMIYGGAMGASMGTAGYIDSRRNRKQGVPRNSTGMYGM